MKSSTVFLIIGIFVIAITLAWISSGGISGTRKQTTPQTPITATVVVEIPGTTTAILQTTVPALSTTTVTPAAVTEPPVSSTPFLISSDDIRNHFLEVAYASTNRLERLNSYGDNTRLTISAVSAGDDDIALIENTVLVFNNASTTVRLSENIKETGTGDILIRFLPEKGVADIRVSESPASGTLWEVLTPKEMYQGNQLAAKIQRGTIYINADLKDGARRHVIVKSLMYQMGLTGETVKFSDSVFFAGENTNVDLSLLDRKVIAMLYGDNFYNGMTVEELRKIIYMP